MAIFEVHILREIWSDTRPGKHTKSELENGPVEIVDVSIENGGSFQFVMLVINHRMVDFPIKNCGFPIKNGDVPIKNCDFPIKNCDFPIKNSDFPIKNCDF